VPITAAGSDGRFATDGKGPLDVSLDLPVPVSPAQTTAYPDGRLQVNRLGSDNLARLIVNGQINPALAANNIEVIKDTHCRTSHVSATDVDALVAYLLSLE
jgi:hypothetical protein